MFNIHISDLVHTLSISFFLNYFFTWKVWMKKIIVVHLLDYLLEIDLFIYVQNNNAVQDYKAETLNPALCSEMIFRELNKSVLIDMDIFFANVH